MARVFSLKKYLSQYVGNDGIYSVGEDIMEQICQNSKTECFAGISREGLTHEILAKTSCHDSLHSSHVLCTWLTSQEVFSRFTCENSFDLQCCLEFSHSLSHTTHSMKSHIKYRVHKIEQNYNQHKIVVNHNFTTS